MLLDESYEVRTHWGWFKLDRGAYEDYLSRKLWITWIPGKSKEQTAEQQKEDVLPPNVTDAAIRLRDLASRHGAYVTFQSAFPRVVVEIPFKQRMNDKPIDELALSVRSSNGLMRGNAGTFGLLWELLSRETDITDILSPKIMPINYECA